MKENRGLLNKQEIIIKENELENFAEVIEKAEHDIASLKEQVDEIENRCHSENRKKSFYQNFKNLIKRLDVNSGTNIVKLVFWIGMAGAIIFLSTDINAEIIGAITYFMGIIFDMLLLRKQLPKDGTSLIRFWSGIFLLLFFSATIILGLGLAASAVGEEPGGEFKIFVDWAMPISGLCSTLIEILNSMGSDD